MWASGLRNTIGNLNDVFAIETEVAQSIANRLRAKVSAREKLALQERPTKDLVAYDLYVQATSLIGQAPHQEHKEQRNNYSELAPIANDSFDGVDALYVFAVICAWTGERDLAMEQLEIVVKIPAGPSYGELRLNPIWDSLRDDPRFDEIIASLAPKEIASK
jgi:hypothetical protein